MHGAEVAGAAEGAGGESVPKCVHDPAVGQCCGDELADGMRGEVAAIYLVIPASSCATASNARSVSSMCGSWECGWLDNLAATTSAARLT